MDKLPATKPATPSSTSPYTLKRITNVEHFIISLALDFKTKMDVFLTKMVGTYRIYEFTSIVVEIPVLQRDRNTRLELAKSGIIG